MSRIDAALIAFLVTTLLLLAMRPVAHSIGMVDRPGGRKTHVGVVPVIGGICMYLGLAIVLPLLAVPMTSQTAFLVGAGLLVLVGCIDDRFDIAPNIRLIAQATAALILCLGAGLVVNNLGNLLFFGDIPLGFLAVPFTVLVIISVINAFNMMDGIDGLAGGVALASLVAAGCAAFLFGDGKGGSLATLAIAVVLAFLLFNFPMPFNRPVRTFMGDAGSTLLGFIVVWVCMRLAHGPEAVISPVTALWIAALPIFDLFISFGRRLRKGQSPLQPDSEHFHHILLRAGLSDRQVLLVMVGTAFLVAMTGILAHRAGVPDGVLFLGLIVLGALQGWTVRRAWRLARWMRRWRRGAGRVRAS
ncbi:MAG: undecaprenyl-phosphate alpha-N-acetylglucosaminyl 1-phosphate transferase [Gammaproteobacteria bacterium]